MSHDTYLCRQGCLEKVPEVAAHCHLLADACDLLPGIVHEVDGPLGGGHVHQHERLAVVADAAATAAVCTGAQKHTQMSRDTHTQKGMLRK